MLACGMLLAAQPAWAASELSLDPASLDLPQTAAGELQQAIASGSWSSAEAILFAAVAENPDNAALRRALGISHYQAGRFWAAASALKRADAATALDPQARYLLANSYLRLERSHWARVELERLIEVQESNEQYRYTLARVYYDQQRFQEAVELLHPAIQQRPAFAAAHDLLGQCLEGLGRIQAAEAAFRTAISLNQEQDRNAAWPQYHLGSLLHDLGDLDAAVGELEDAVQSDPLNLPAHLELGVALKKLNKLRAAAEVLEAAARIAPNDATVQYSLGGIYMQLGRDDRAAAAIERFRAISTSGQ